MSSLPLEGKGLFVFSDPGGAKPLLSLIYLNNLKESSLVFSDRQYSFYEEFGVEVQPYDNHDIQQIIDDYSPGYLFTGTSYTSDLELEFIKTAKANGVTSYAFVDHYTMFRDRFKLSLDDYVFPDFICVLDQSVLERDWEVESELIVTGNFYHDYLRRWKPEISKSDLFKTLGVPLENRLLVYAPDPLTNVGGSDKWGADELTTMDFIMERLQEWDSTSMVIKIHPNQVAKLLENKVREYPINIGLVPGSIDTNALLYHADAVIGMFSNILLESHILGTPSLRCLVGLKMEDPLGHLDFGYRITDSKDLQTVMSQI